MSNNALKMKDNDLLSKILKSSKSSEIDYYLICNSDSIKKALDLQISKRQIYLTVIKESNLTVAYSTFMRKLENLTKIIEQNKINNSKDEILSDKIIDSKTDNNNPKIIAGSHKKFEYNNDKN